MRARAAFASIAILGTVLLGPAPTAATVPTPPTSPEGSIERITPVVQGQFDAAPVWVSPTAIAHTRMTAEYVPEQDHGDWVEPAYWRRVAERLVATSLGAELLWTGGETGFAVGGQSVASIELNRIVAGPFGARRIFDLDGTRLPDLPAAGGILGDVLDFAPLSGKVMWSGLDGVYVADVDGSNATLIPNSGSAGSFSPDGTQVVTNGNQTVLVSSIAGTAQRAIARGNIPSSELAWSPDGTKIAGADNSGLVLLDPSATARSGDCWPEDSPECWIEAGTGDPPRVVTRDGGPSNPRWSPDGSRLMVLRSLPSGISVVERDGSNLRDLSPSESVGPGITAASWSPDGTAIAFASSAESPYESEREGQGSSIYVLTLDSDTDADGDGIDDTIDTGDGTFTNGVTSGAISDAAGHSVSVTAAGPDEVRITVAGIGSADASFTVCGFTLRLEPGSEVVLSCGSITTRVISGSAELILGNGLSVVTVRAGVTATLDEAADGSFGLTGISGGSVTVMVDGVTTEIAAGQNLTIEAWDFMGFAAPVDNGGVLNVVKAGQSVPLRWRVLNAAGAPVTDLSTAIVRVGNLGCSSGGGSDQLEETATGTSRLQHLGDGYYQLNWKTTKTYADSCRTMGLDIGDGVEHTALFRFTK